MERKSVALDNEVLRGVVGSTAHGTALDGQDDRDEMGVFIEPPEYVCGLRELDHYIYRSQPEGVRSGPGDLDLTLYSLRKFCRLASAGNPSVLALLWLPEHIICTPHGRELVSLRDAFVSREAGQRFLGYLISQRKRLTGEHSKTVNRPELIERYGYDTKFAMHALRLGLQGIEYLTERRITLPIPEPALSLVRAVRMGEVSFSDALRLIVDTEAILRGHVDACDMKADKTRIDTFLIETHWRHWEGICGRS